MMSDKKNDLSLVINIDGASKGNPGPAGIGVVIRDASDGEVIFELGEFHGEMTNNRAEYTALIRALEYALVFRAGSVTIRSDSQLLVRQMTGRYRVKSPRIEPLFRWATDLARVFESVDFEDIPRENNRDADALAQQSVRTRNRARSGTSGRLPGLAG